MPNIHKNDPKILGVNGIYSWMLLMEVVDGGAM
jgi:hypothetical protein